MGLISSAPEKILNLLETHPNILKTGAALVAFLAAKDQILGTKEVIIGPDGKPVQIPEGRRIRRLCGNNRKRNQIPLSNLLL